APRLARTKAEAVDGFTATEASGNSGSARLPVLSKTTRRIPARRSSSSGELTTNPACTNRVRPRRNNIGNATPMAHGQATSKTASEALSAAFKLEARYQNANAARLAINTNGRNQRTNRSATLSTGVGFSRSASTLARSASSLRPPPGRVVVTVRGASSTTPPAQTSSPVARDTGNGSPVSVHSRTNAYPLA